MVRSPVARSLQPEPAVCSSAWRSRTDVPDTAPTILCIATYEKGQEFIRECKRQGCRVLLLTVDSLKDADWPREAIDDTFYIPREIPREDLLKGISHLARSRVLDRIVALDDFDVETAALLREHLRIPGMGETTARYFRDKLAMRVKARNQGVLVPEFVHTVNDDQVRRFAEGVPGPWMLKPRSNAAAIGITRIERIDELWPALDALGDRRSFYLLERFVKGDVFHVDALVWERDVIFHAAHQYGAPPFSVAHQGGIFTTRTVAKAASAWKPLMAINREVSVHAGPGARRRAHRVHPQRRGRPLVLPRDLRPRRRRLHRRRGAGRHRHQPLVRVGQDRDRRRRPALSPAQRQGRLCRARAHLVEAGAARHLDATPIRRSSTA